MSANFPQEATAVRINRYEKAVHDADLATARRIAQSLGVPLAFLYADTDVLAEAILTLGLLSKSEQRKAVADLKARLAQAGASAEKG
ncbi:transcriptional regulator [Lysobacter antibioticus]|uniref:transcriptional regulator n=1 Tax=Lysobacter antibioticus TaxID=84531 RepID=UPI0003451924|nr:transcriptional regulator [Lysobacter antibioticus]